MRRHARKADNAATSLPDALPLFEGPEYTQNLRNYCANSSRRILAVLRHFAAFSAGPHSVVSRFSSPPALGFSTIWFVQGGTSCVLGSRLGGERWARFAPRRLSLPRSRRPATVGPGFLDRKPIRPIPPQS